MTRIYVRRQGALYPLRCARCGVPKAHADFRKDKRKNRPEGAIAPYCVECSRRYVKDAPSSIYGDEKLLVSLRKAYEGQNVSLPSASRRGEVWTAREDLAVSDYSRTALDIALELGRTKFAVQRRRKLILDGERERATSVAAAHAEAESRMRA